MEGRDFNQANILFLPYEQQGFNFPDNIFIIPGYTIYYQLYKSIE